MSAIKNVVIGMSGKMDSFVAAYLLKKQGLNVIGVCVQMVDPNDPLFARPRVSSVRDAYGDENRANDLSYIPQFLPQCHIADMEKARAQAEHLDIPFYAVNALSEFKSIVLDRVLSAGILGEKLFPCMFCHQLLISILEKKADILKAEMVATGHYAHVHILKSKKVYVVASSNDLTIDQSLKLSQLTQSQLSRLILPLAEMRRDEVVKIAQSMSRDVQISQPETSCFMSSPYLPEFIERTTPPSLRKPGNVLRYEDDLLVRDHVGIHTFMLGEKPPELRTDQIAAPGDESFIVVQKGFTNGAVFVANEKNLSFKSFVLTQVILNPLMDMTKTRDAVAHLALHKDRWPCVIHFKNNQMLLVELKTEMAGHMSQGAAVGIYDSAEKGARLIAVGIVTGVPILNSVFFKRQNDKDVAHVTACLERNKKLGF